MGKKQRETTSKPKVWWKKEFKGLNHIKNLRSSEREVS
jgi:hypothetical protein